MTTSPVDRPKITFSLRSLFVAIAVIAVGLFIFRGCSSFVSESEAKQIHYGMTKQQVERILGPAHVRPNYDPDKTWLYSCDFPSYLSDPLVIRFDDDGHVDWISR